MVEKRMRCANQYEVLVGAKVLEDIYDLDVEALGLRPAENRESVPAHAGLDLTHRHRGDARSWRGIGADTENGTERERCDPEATASRAERNGWVLH
jgi:hypothetical protein